MQVKNLFFFLLIDRQKKTQLLFSTYVLPLWNQVSLLSQLSKEFLAHTKDFNGFSTTVILRKSKNLKANDKLLLQFQFIAETAIRIF